LRACWLLLSLSMATATLFSFFSPFLLAIYVSLVKIKSASAQKIREQNKQNFNDSPFWFPWNML
jgi:hypothetical protein